MILQRCLTIVLILVALVEALGQQTGANRKAGEKLTDITEIVNKSAHKFMSDRRSVGLSVGIIKDGRSWTFNFGEAGKSHPLNTRFMNWRQLLKLLPESCSHKPPRKEKLSLAMTYGNILTAATRIWSSKESPSNSFT
jgi:hypothetical protein